MSRTANPSSSWFQAVVQTSQDAWMALRCEFSEFFENKSVQVLYGLPESLIDALDREAPGFMTDRELRFEDRLLDFLRMHNSIGLDGGKLVRSGLFEVRAPMKVSPDDFDALGWKKTGLTCDSVNRMCEQGESRGLLIHEQLVAYAGWLITNPTYLTEVAALRQREHEFLSADAGSSSAEACSCDINAFLSRWQLAGMSTWDLPEPQGPNLAGIDLPVAARRNAEAVRFELSLTFRLPARFPMREVIAEIRNQSAQSNLDEWHHILDQDSKEEVGLQRFRHMLRMQFYRNIVLQTRYPDRFKGRVADLDRAFGRFLGGLGDDSAKKLRLEISRRCKLSVKNQA